MILFLADLHGVANTWVLPHLKELDYKYNVLESYFWLKDQKDPEVKIKEIAAEKVFLDSGAYTAFNKGLEIDVHEYSKFVVKYGHLFNVIASLDVKGNPEKSWENQKIMESYGLHPLPAYHIGEDLSWFHKYLDNYEYFGIGTSVEPYHSDRLRREFEQLFRIAPDHKFHGYGMTDTRWCAWFPWHTVDSLSWCLSGAYGSIKFWDKTLGKTIIAVVTLLDKPRKKYAQNHILNWGSKKERIEFIDRVKKLNLDYKRVSSENYARCVVNLAYYLDFADWINEKPVKFESTEDSFT